MALLLSIISGIVAMLSYGISDFLLKKPSKDFGGFKTTFLIYIVGILFSVPLFIYLYILGFPQLYLTEYLLLILMVVLDIFAFTNFLTAIKIGELSIITPIISGYAMITVILGIIFGRTEITFNQSIAVLLIIFGMILTSTDLRKLKKVHTVAGVKNALVAFLAWGLFVFLMDILMDNLSRYGLLMALITSNTYLSLISIFFLAIMFIAFKELKTKPYIPEAPLFLRILLITLIFKCAWVALSYGLMYGNLSIVAPVSSLSPVVTVILAQVFYKEKLVLNQKYGIFLILSGLVLISI